MNMAYIELEELKEVLVGALDCCGLDAESIEWVLQEVEQKFHIGKKPDGKKKKKSKESEDLTELRYAAVNKRLKAVETRAFNECVGKGAIDRIDNKITQLDLSIKDIGGEIVRIQKDIKATKSMAETAINRTEINYSGFGEVNKKIKELEDSRKTQGDLFDIIIKRITEMEFELKSRNTHEVIKALAVEEPVKINAAKLNDKEFAEKVTELRANGMSDIDIAKSMGLTTTWLRHRLSQKDKIINSTIEVYGRCSRRGATKDELDEFKALIEKYIPEANIGG